jgi:hypothetical protein
LIHYFNTVDFPFFLHLTFLDPEVHTFEHQCADALPWFSLHHDACCEGTKSWPSPLMTPQNASSQGVDADLLVDLPLFSSPFVKSFRKEFGGLTQRTPQKTGTGQCGFDMV